MAGGKLKTGQYFHVHIFTTAQITFPATIKKSKKGLPQRPPPLFPHSFLDPVPMYLQFPHTSNQSVDLVLHPGPFH